ncbi:MAG: alcohol dehydrogenase catalytic domain-containing protein [Anaerolineaceae bacterium]|nr:alcohol dehydrogenase catalytic domain-containing protein [Anaerolineaceae bacterium]
MGKAPNSLTRGQLKNRTAWVIQPGKVELIDSSLPELSDNEVLIQIKASAICGSDLHLYQGKHPAVRLPSAVGHECSGLIFELGKQVKGFNIGDRVTFEPNINCGRCKACLQGNYGYCENISFTYRIGKGAIADYIVIREDKVFKLPDAMPFNQGALIEPLAVAVHAVKRADIQMGEEVLVIGAGAIGIFTGALSILRGASKVVVSDINRARLDLAIQLGATGSMLSSDLENQLHTKTLAVYDKVFECVGLEKTLANAMKASRRNGLVTVVGIFEEENVSIPANLFASHEIRMQGSQGYCWDFPVALKLAEKIALDKMLTHRFPLSEVQKAFELAMDRTAFKMKVIIEP